MSKSKVITYEKLVEMSKDLKNHKKLVIFGDTKGNWLKEGLVAVEDDVEYRIGYEQE